MNLSPMIRDGMVVQAGKPIYIRGCGDGRVSARFCGAEKSLDAHGDWVLEFPPLDYGGPYRLEIDLDGQSEIVNDIVVGEVILFSGQSNIQFRLEQTNVPKCEYIYDDNARTYVCPHIEEGDKLYPENGWVKSSCENAGYWSALAYLVAREARRAGVPYVGTVVCSQGASVIETRLPEELLDAPEFALPIEKKFSDHVDYPWNTPGQMYRYAMKDILPYSFGNVVWYQGESNTTADKADIYPKLLKLLTDNIRRECRDATLPFRIVQIADTRDWPGWLAIQKAQSDYCETDEHSFLIRSGDICERDMIHPITKSLLAARIYLDMRTRK